MVFFISADTAKSWTSFNDGIDSALGNTQTKKTTMLKSENVNPTAGKYIGTLIRKGNYLYAGTNNGIIWKRKIENTIKPTDVINISKSSVTLYPVPVSNILNIGYDNPPEQTSYVIYNLNGIEVYSSNISNNITTLDMSDFAPGMYIIRITSPAGSVIAKKIIKL